jgi:hypothetical protein
MTIDDLICEYETDAAIWEHAMCDPDDSEKARLLWQQKWEHAEEVLKLLKNIRAEVVDEFVKTKTDTLKWLIKRQAEGYGTSNGELLDHIYEIAEKMKKGGANA